MFAATFWNVFFYHYMYGLIIKQLYYINLQFSSVQKDRKSLRPYSRDFGNSGGHFTGPIIHEKPGSQYMSYCLLNKHILIILIVFQLHCVKNICGAEIVVKGVSCTQYQDFVSKKTNASRVFIIAIWNFT